MNVIVPGKFNPFASAAIDSIPFRFARGDWQDNLSRLAQLGYHGAIVGPKGTGKTTLLEQLQVKLQNCTDNEIFWVRIPFERCDHGRLMSTLSKKKKANAILLVDCSERLSLANRIRLKCFPRAPGGLVVTCHRKSSLPVWVHCRSTPESLQHVLSQLTSHLDSTLQDELSSDAAMELARRGENIREVLRTLYDRVAEGRYGASPFWPLPREAVA